MLQRAVPVLILVVVQVAAQRGFVFFSQSRPILHDFLKDFPVTSHSW